MGTRNLMEERKSLTEKYRPVCLSEVFGQKENVHALSNLLENNLNKFPNLLLHGPPGTGKTTTALVLARSILKNSVSRNLLELNASDQRGIAAIREKVKLFACLRPSSSEVPFKIIILDEADSLTPDAQNALRRVIEEYSAHTRFLFLCNYLGKISSALQSRCTLMFFDNLALSDISSALSFLCEKYDLKHSKPLLERIASSSNGDLRKATSKLESLLYSSDTKMEKVLDEEDRFEKKISDFAENLSFCKDFSEWYFSMNLYDNLCLPWRSLVKKLASMKKDNLKLLVRCNEIDLSILRGANGKLQLCGLYDDLQ